MSDSGFAILFVVFMAIAPIAASIAASFALTEVVPLRRSRWILLPIALLLLVVWTLLFGAVTLFYSPSEAPTLYAPMLGLLLLTWLLTLPVAAFAFVRGLVLLRDHRTEAYFCLAAGTSFCLLYFVFDACGDFLPSV